MTFRGLRNGLVFWSTLGGAAYALHHGWGWGWMGSIGLGFVLALVAVLVAALATDRFMD